MTRKSFPMNDLLTTRDAAVMLGMSLRSVQLFCEAGRLSCVRTPGGHRRIPKADVQALIAAGGGATETPAQLPGELARAQGVAGEGPFETAPELAAALLRGEKIVREGRPYVIEALIDVGAPGEANRGHTAGRRE